MVLIATMSIIGTLYASHSVHAASGAARWVVIVAIYIFAITYCMSTLFGAPYSLMFQKFRGKHLTYNQFSVGVVNQSLR